MAESIPHQVKKIIQQRLPNFTPELGIILGSGLGPLVEKMTETTVFPYQELPGFPQTQIQGHGGKLHLGLLNGTKVACLQGRAHRYEGDSYPVLKTMIRSLKLLGCDKMLITNASGSLRPEMAPGDIVMITDHINFSFGNPLVGPNDDEFGERFLGMEDVYDTSLCEKMRAMARDNNIKLHEGIYFGMQGPCFETPAEIRAFRILGADIIGMSTIPDIILAHHCGLKVVALAAITNYAAGMSEVKLSHHVTLTGAKLATEKLQDLVFAYAGNLHHG